MGFKDLTDKNGDFSWDVKPFIDVENPWGNLMKMIYKWWVFHMMLVYGAVNHP